MPNTPSLFHKEIYAPAAVFKSPGILDLWYTSHAKLAAQSDRYGDLTPYLKDRINFDEVDIIEVEVNEGLIQKWVIRFSVTAELDLVMAVARNGNVKTVWANRVYDVHKSLDYSRYKKKPNKIPVFH